MLNPTNNRTLLLGASGFLGSYFVENLPSDLIVQTTQANYFNESQNCVVKKLESGADIDDLFINNSFTRVINCIALADIDKCEIEREKAKWLNTDLPGIVAKKCLLNSKQYLHISTDAVFDGSSAPYHEYDLVSPLSYYGHTKAEGESMVLQNNINSFVFRVNFFGRNLLSSSLFDYFYNSLISGKEVIGFEDVIFTTMAASETVRISHSLLKFGKPGIYHVVGNESLSKYEFGRLIAKEMGLDLTLITPGSGSSHKGAQLRSKNLQLKNDKMLSYGIKPEDIRSGIRKLIERSGYECK